MKQILAVTMFNIRSIPARWGISSVVIVGTAGVVGVLVAIFAMAAGITSVLTKSAAEDRALVLRTGASGEMSSNINMEQRAVVGAIEGIELAAPELYVVADIPKRDTGLPANVIVRGVTELSFELRPEIKIESGRTFLPGRNELIVGEKAVAEFAGVEVGDAIEIRGAEWEIVGIFSADGAAYESELWVDLAIGQSAWRRGQSITSVRLQLESPAAFEAVQEIIDEDKRLNLTIVEETEFYANQTEGATQVIRVFGLAVAVIMSIGAIFAALNTMYAAVASRTFEIATLRAMGFSGGSVVVSVMVEAVFLSLLGGLLGAAFSYVVFNGFTVSTLNQAAFSQLAFEFEVTLALVGYGLVIALCLGLFGGLFPAVRAALQPVTVALQRE